MLLDKALDRLKQALPQSGLVGAARRGGNQVHKRLPNHRALGRVGQDPLAALALGEGVIARSDMALLGPQGHHEILGLQRLHEVGTQPTVVAPLLALSRLLLNQHRGDPWQQNSPGLEASSEFCQRNVAVVEILGVGPDLNSRASGPLGRTHLAKRGDPLTALKLDLPLGIIAPDRDLKPCGERIGDRDAHTVQPSGEGIGAARSLVELSARMQPGVDNLHDRNFLLRVGAHWNAASVVGHADAAVEVLGHQNGARMSGQGLICSVVDDLLHDVQWVLGSGVHAGPLPHGLEPFENPYG